VRRSEGDAAAPDRDPVPPGLLPSLRAASDRTLSVYFGIRADAYDARFYEGELKRIVEKHRHKLSDEDREVVDRELPRIKRSFVLRPVACPFMAAFADETKGVLRLIRLPEETEDRLRRPAALAPLELMLRKHRRSARGHRPQGAGSDFRDILDEVIPSTISRARRSSTSGQPGTRIQAQSQRKPVKANMASGGAIIDREGERRLLQAAVPGRRTKAWQSWRSFCSFAEEIITGPAVGVADRSVGELESTSASS